MLVRGGGKPPPYSSIDSACRGTRSRAGTGTMGLADGQWPLLRILTVVLVGAQRDALAGGYYPPLRVLTMVLVGPYTLSPSVCPSGSHLPPRGRLWCGGPKAPSDEKDFPVPRA